MTLDAPAGQAQGGRHRGVGVIAAGLAVFVYAVSAPGALGSEFDGYVWAARLLDHQMVFGIIGCGLLVLATALLLRGWRLVVSLLAVLGLGAVWTLGGLVGAAFAPVRIERLSGVENPDHTLRTHALQTGIVDPLYEIQVEQVGRGLLSRRFTVGCIDGDALSVDQLRWEGGALVVDSSAGALAITIGEDGAPDGVRSVPDHSLDEGSVGPLRLLDC